MRLGILGHAESWYVNDLSRAAKKLGHQAERIDYCTMTSSVLNQQETFSAEQSELLACDALIVRTMPPGSLEQVVFRMDALARIEASGVAVINPPRSIECAVDKYLATARIASAGLPVPDTVVCESANAAVEAFKSLGGDVLVKPLFGAEGRGIIRINHLEMARRVFRTLERIDAVIYLQRFIPHDGSDLRILVLDGQVLACMRRIASDGLRSNVACDGRAEPAIPDDDEIQLALRAAEATGTLFSGIDLLRGNDGQPYLLEVNAVPGWRALKKVTGVDVATRLIQWLAEHQSA